MLGDELPRLLSLVVLLHLSGELKLALPATRFPFPAHMLTPADLVAYIAAHGIIAELITNIGDTPTVPAAAQSLGVSTDQIIKTLLFFIAGDPYAVISNGTAPIPVRSLASHLGVGKRQVKLAQAEEVVAITGYPAGGVPPIGHRTSIPVLLDRSVLAQEEVFGGGGDHRTMLRMRVAELVRVTRPTLLDLT